MENDFRQIIAKRKVFEALEETGKELMWEGGALRARSAGSLIGQLFAVFRGIVNQVGSPG